MLTQEAPPVPKKSAPRRAYHERLVALFVQHTRIDDVVKASGLSRKTISRWKNIPENWEQVSAARGDVLNDALSRLRNAMPRVADMFVELADDRKQPGSVRLRAGAEVMAAFAGLSQRTEFEQRLAELEARARRHEATPLTWSRPSLMSSQTSPDPQKAA